MSRWIAGLTAGLLFIFLSGLRPCASCAATSPLFAITALSAEALNTSGTACEVLQSDGMNWLRVSNGEVAITPPHTEWDLSAAEGINLRLRNLNSSSVVVRLMAMNPDASNLMNSCRNAVEIPPKETVDFLLRLTRRPEDPTYLPFEPFYMYFKAINVRDDTIDPAHVSKLKISIDGGRTGAGVAITNISASGHGVPAPVPFFPFIDQYGQYLHGDWPGKIHSDADFSKRIGEEQKEQTNWPGPNDRDRYGGWASGPAMQATGFYHATKYQGKWWLIDPAGRLFWSYGLTGVDFGGDATPITDRPTWFASLPAQDKAFGPFYQNGHGATYQYYQNRQWVGFNVQGANLLRKYGPDFKQRVAEISHQRLHSWGFNTMGNWSSPEIYALHKTPYTVAIAYGSPLIHFHMPDVYDPSWETALRKRMDEERTSTANDPWNLGYFIDNERWFGWRPRGAAIGEETLKNPPDRKAKVKFLELLKAKYKTIGALNMAWAKHYESWGIMQRDVAPPDMKNAAVLTDCGDFGMMFSERYFSVCRQAVKAVAPNNLYLGSRFFGHTDPELVKLAARYCDVISYNIYDNPPDSRVNEYAKLDVPILSSEWGITSDPLQTPFRDIKLTALTPAERAAMLTDYIEHALKLPNLVGAHFFQYRDQPLSGRADGEATLRGFVNVADTPNFELIQANRQIAYRMYNIRSESK